MLFTRLGSPQNTSSTRLSADTAYFALWCLLITHWQIPNRIFTDCWDAALQAQEVVWINHTCTHAMNKAPNSKSQVHAAHPDSHEFRKSLSMTVGYGPYTARGEMCSITTAYVLLQLQIFFQGQIVLCPVEASGWSLADPHPKFNCIVPLQNPGFFSYSLLRSPVPSQQVLTTSMDILPPPPPAMS